MTCSTVQHTERRTEAVVTEEGNPVRTVTVLFLSCSTCLWASPRFTVEPHILEDPPALAGFWSMLEETHATWRKAHGATMILDAEEAEHRGE